MATSTNSPNRFPVAIDGRDYMADLQDYQRVSLDLFRQQADAGREFDEGSLNPEDLWRRTQVDWRMGAGVEFLDRGATTDTARQQFDESENIDPWVDGGKLQLMKDTTRVLARTATKLKILPGMYDKRAFVADLATTTRYFKYTDNGGSSWTDVTGSPAADEIADIEIVGGILYAATDWGGAGGGELYRWTQIDPLGVGSLVMSTPGSPLKKLAYVKGRFMAAKTLQLYDISSLPASLPAALHTFNSPISCIGSSSSYILIATSDTADGGRSLVYRIAIRDDATTLSAPVACGELPDGEVVNCIVPYVGVILLGTSNGVRVGQMSGGELTYGPLVDVGAVDAIEPQGNYAWAHLSASGTLARLDLSRFAEPLLPAYADDLHPAASAAVTGNVRTYQDKRFFTAGDGVYAEASTYAASGTLTSGIITFGVADDKVVALATAKCEPIPAGCTVQLQVLSADDDSVLLDSGALGVGTTEVSISGSVTDYPDGVRYRLTLTSTGADTPVVTRVTVYANPIPRRGERIVLPLILRTDVRDMQGEDTPMDPYEEFLALKTLERTGVPVDYQEFGETYRAFIDAIQFGPELEYDKNGKPQGRCIVSMRIFE